MRKFGWIKLLPTTELKEEKFIAKLGPEPLIGNPTPEYLKRMSRHPKSLVKAALLNQEIVAGIGNIYADEALWGAMIHPKTRVENLSKKQLEDIMIISEDYQAIGVNVAHSGTVIGVLFDDNCEESLIEECKQKILSECFDLHYLNLVKMISGGIIIERE